jgi:hypothetical protein
MAAKTIIFTKVRNNKWSNISFQITPVKERFCFTNKAKQKEIQVILKSKNKIIHLGTMLIFLNIILD